MKKTISLLLSAVMGVSALTAAPVTAENRAGSSGGVVIFGDSIASGYGLADNEYNYGQIIGDYLGCSVENYAHSGDTTEDLLNKLSHLSSDQKNAVGDSDYIIISIGGNDVIQYTTKMLLDFAAKKGLLNKGYTAADIPEKPDISDLNHMLNIYGEGGLMEYAQGSLEASFEFTILLKDIASNFRFSTGSNKGYIANNIMPNIDTAVKELRAMNPDARIIVQTIYQPLQFDPAYVEAKFGADSQYEDVLGILRKNFKDIFDAFRTELNTVDDIEVADVYYQFTSVPDSEKQNAENPGYSYILTDIQSSGEERDFHPNQKGHLAIAATILETIGDLHDDDGLLSAIFLNMEPYNSDIKYPLLATDTYKRVAGNILNGDVDFNGIIDGSDATLILREFGKASGGFNSTLSGIQHDCADTNGDGIVDGSDATNILRYFSMCQSGYEGTFDDLIKDIASQN